MTRLLKYIENFTTKTRKFSDKNSDNFHISDQNVDCWYLSEPSQRSDSNEYSQSVFEQKQENKMYPCKTVLLYKSWVYGVKII